MRFLSPLLTYTTKTVAGANDASAGDATELKWEFEEDLGRYYVSFPDDVVEPSWDDRGSSIWGLSSFSFGFDCIWMM